MNDLVVLPLLIPMLTAILCLLVWGRPRAQQWIGVVGSVAHLICGGWLLWAVMEHGVLASSVGNWPVPFGIVIVADTLSAVMVLLTGIASTAVSIYAIAEIDMVRVRHGFVPLFHALIMGVSGAFTTGDIFNLYVWFEVMLTASFVLLALGGGKRQMIGGIKYVTLNLLSSAIFLAGVGILYGMTGTLNMAELAVVLRDNDNPQLVAAIGTMFLVAFGLKAALFPLFFWLPAAYHAPPAAVSAIFSGLLTKVGIYSLTRMFTLVFTTDLGWTHGVLLTLAGITLIIGILGAIAQSELRRVLAFQIVSHVGYIVMGLGLLVSIEQVGGLHGLEVAVREAEAAQATDAVVAAAGDAAADDVATPGEAGAVLASDGGPAVDPFAIKAAVTLALTGAVLYIIHEIIVATSLFLLAGVIERRRGTGVLRRLGGLWRTAPGLCLLFLISALALSGVPPFSGFWGKLALVKAGLDLSQWAIVVAALATGALTLFSMMTVFGEVFWKDAPDDAEPEGESADAPPRPTPMTTRDRVLMTTPIVALTVLILCVGLMPQPFYRVANRAAEQLVDPSEYITAVKSISIVREPMVKVDDKDAKGAKSDTGADDAKGAQDAAGGDD